MSHEGSRLERDSFLFIISNKTMSKTYLTKNGYEELKKKIAYLTSVERPRISQEIADARDKGDLSENAEYDAAKEAQGILESKILQLQETFRNARIVDEGNIETDVVQIMNKVKIKNTANKAVMEYTIVPEMESNLKDKKISVETPIARALLGKKVGDTVAVEVPAGKVNFEIIEISL